MTQQAKPLSAIPGPQTGSIMGSAAEFAANSPEFLLNIAKDYGGIARFRFLNQRFVLVSDPDLVREMLVTRSKEFPKADRDVFILNRFIGEGLVTTNGQQHTAQRRLAQPAFHSRRIEAYADTMSDYTAELIADWQTGDHIDMSREMRDLTMYIVSKTLFDTDKDTMADEALRIGNAIHDMQAITDRDYERLIQTPDWWPSPDNRKRNRARQVLHDTINNLIQQRRAEEATGDGYDRGDLLSMFLATQDEGGRYMSNREVLDQLVTVFVAGHETTSNALMWTWYLLSQHPEIADRLYKEVDDVLDGRLPTLADMRRLPFTEKVIKESMRLYPPVWVLMGRQAAADTTLGGYHIPAGTLFFLAPYVMHRLPQYFPNPETFDPDRFTPEMEKALPKYTYMPFGGGPRICIGNSFAMMEAILIIAVMAQQFEFELAAGQEVNLNAQVTLSNVGGMHMVAKRRVSAATPISTPDLAIA